MTTERASPDSPQAARATKGLNKGVLVLLAAIVLVGAGWYFWKPLVLWSVWVNGADKPQFQDKLMREEDPAVLDRLEACMRDADKGDLVRRSCANILIAKNRLVRVEAALRDPRLDLRAVALSALGDLKQFQSEYVANPSYGVPKTLLEWLGDSRLPGRVHGMKLVARVFRLDEPPPPELLATLRAALAPSQTAGSSEMRQASAAMLAAYKDCDSAATILALSTTEAEGYARMQLLNSAVRLYESAGKPCAEQLPDEAVRKAVLAALTQPGDGDRNRGVRMAAMGVLRRYPEWSKEAIERLRGVLADVRIHEVERRTVLETLVTAKDEPTLDRFERWFHDPAAGVRATAAGSVADKAPGIKDPERLLACVVGYLRDEPHNPYELTFQKSFLLISEKADDWVGLPARWRKPHKSPRLLGDVQEGLTTLLRKGALEGRTRHQVGDDLFRWLATFNGVAEAEGDAALKVRADFWVKAKAGDVAGARAIYVASMQKPVNLWTYELGWLESKAK